MSAPADPPLGSAGSHPAEAPHLFEPARELTPRLGQRDLFGALRPLVYMNHAGISPPSVLVRKAVGTLLADYERHGLGAFLRWSAQRDRLKGKLAALIGAPGGAASIALVQSTTRGVADVALCMPWEPGDRVVLFRGEFPANVTPWQQAARAFGAEVVMLEADLFRRDEEAALAALEQVLAAGRVRVVAASAVQFQTGHRMPLAAIGACAHRHGALSFVDAVQACGMVPVDVVRDEIDALACGAHKWLMGLEGAGFVFARPELAARLVPRVAGWLSHEQPVDFLLEGAGRLRYDKPIRAEISFLELGNVSATAFAGLEASLDAILALDRDAIFRHVQAIHDAIEPRAVELGLESLRTSAPSGRSGSLCFRPPPDVDPVALVAELGRQGVACGLPDGVLRLSPHWPNAVDEAEQVLLALAHALALARQ